MKEDFYLEIIEKGARKGIYKYVDISTELYTFFANKNNLPDHQYSNISQNVDKYFAPLLVDGYFTIQNNCKEANPSANRNWKDAINVKLSITPKGLIFINENRKLNLTYRANSLTRMYIFVTIVIGVCTLIIGGMNLNISKGQLTISKQLSNQQKSISKMERHIKRLQQDSVRQSALYPHKAELNYPKNP